MDPLVSILIPAYNVQEWIADTIQSALAQTWHNKEIIIVDDGSTDQTLPIARQFASKRVVVFDQSHHGAAVTRNKAYSLCQGDYIQWLDADDLLSFNKIEKQLATLRESAGERTLVSCAWGSFRYRSHRAKFTPTPLWCDLTALEWLLRKWEHHAMMPPITWLVSRELSEVAGAWDSRLSYDDDGEYFSRVILASDNVRFVREARALYRRRLESLSDLGQSDQKLESQFLSTQLQIERLRSLEDSQRVRAACIRHLQHWLVFFHPKKVDICRSVKQIALSLGGDLEAPRLPRKYVLIQKTFGWHVAKRTQLHCHRCKSAITRRWDLALSKVDKPSGVASTAHPDLNPQ
jgi:glycosyltransferase involved in cell wall biosynthesis